MGFSRGEVFSGFFPGTFRVKKREPGAKALLINPHFQGSEDTCFLRKGSA
jgi:hypothetical protein